MKTLYMATGGRNGVRLQDIMYPVQAVSAADPDGARLAWRWFIQRRRVIVARLKGANVRLLGAVIQRAAGAVADRSHANAVEAFFQQHPVAGLERSIAQVVENIRTDAKFVMRLEEEMKDEERRRERHLGLLSLVCNMVMHSVIMYALCVHAIEIILYEVL